jgi:capsular polysaccharide biosynthesis protein
MENIQYSKILRKNWELVALVTGLAIVIALVVSLVSPFQYSASTQILIIQKQEKNLDAYTATKSAERIGKNLASIISTSSFYNEVIESNSSISSKFPTDSTERRKAWKKNIQADVIPESGILQIKVYDVDRSYASQLVRSIAYVLVNKGAEYHGGGTDVEIKVVDDVYISKYPDRPNIVLNLGIALIAGILLGSYWVIMRESSKIQRYREARGYQASGSDYSNHNIHLAADYAPSALASARLGEAQAETRQNFGFEVEANANKRTPKIVTMHDHLK